MWPDLSPTLLTLRCSVDRAPGIRFAVPAHPQCRHPVMKSLGMLGASSAAPPAGHAALMLHGAAVARCCYRTLMLHGAAIAR